MDLSTLVRRFDCQPLPETGSSPVVLRRALSPCTSLNALITGCLTATLSFSRVVMRGKHLPVFITSNCSPSRRCLGRVIISILWVGAENWRGLVSFVFRRLLSLHVTPVTFQKIMLVPTWFGKLKHRCLWYAHSSRFSVRPALAPGHQFLVIVSH